MPDGQMPDERMPDGQMPEGRMPDGQMPEGRMRDECLMNALQMPDNVMGWQSQKTIWDLTTNNSKLYQ